jgi:Ankyrin repeats (many copies)
MGARMDAKDREGRSALHLASQYGRISVAYLLLDRGADLFAKTNDGKTPLNVAANGPTATALCMHQERSTKPGGAASSSGGFGSGEAMRPLLEMLVEQNDQQHKEMAALVDKFSGVNIVKLVVDEDGNSCEVNISELQQQIAAYEQKDEEQTMEIAVLQQRIEEFELLEQQRLADMADLQAKVEAFEAQESEFKKKVAAFGALLQG